MDWVIIKNNYAGEEVWRYPGRLLQRSLRGLLFEAFFNRADMEFNGIVLKKNDRFLELYPAGKFFNIYAIYDRDDGLLKAWYCNVTRPARENDCQLEYDDLALDLLVFPDGRQLLLDKAEFEELPLSAEERRQALQAAAELKVLFAREPLLDLEALLRS